MNGPEQAPVHGGRDDDDLMRRFWAYETALMSDDVAAMAELFAKAETTMRGDAAGLLLGHERITAFRTGRGGAPQRTVVEVHRRDLGADIALLVAITEPNGGGRGQQTQVWQRIEGLWKVTAAHVAQAAPAFDARIWRVVGDPLVPPSTGARDEAASDRPALAGRSVAVKDLFAVAGHKIGAGSPAWLEQAATEQVHATAVEALLTAGAGLRGLARTDEFAYSLAGTNTHYGTPPNPRAPHRISGGSSSGSASAVSMGHADIGLGTDTGGSIRVPSAYQGLWGLRSTHGLISREGLLPLAQSFDTVGWMTRDPELFRSVTEVMVDRARTDPSVPVNTELVATAQELTGPPVLLTGLLGLADDDVATAVHQSAAAVRAVEEIGPSPEEAHRWRGVFQTVQAGEAWANHGRWVSRHWDRLAPDVAARFVAARDRTAEDLAAACEEAERCRKALRALVGTRVVAIPSASSVAPPITQATAGGPAVEAARAATMALTSLAGLAGLPAVSVPIRTTEGLPTGLCLIGPAGSDLALVRYATAWCG